MTSTRTTIGALALAGLLALTGCGSDSDGDGTATDGASAPVGGPLLDREQLEAIEKCLTAAGLEDKIPDLPTDVPTGVPSDRPNDFQGTPPAGGPDGGAFGAFQDADVRAALAACGIELSAPTTPRSG